MNDSPFPQSKKRSPVLVIILVILVLFLLGGIGVYAYLSYAQKPQDTVSTGQSEVEVLVAKIGEKMELPEEEPSLATVSDVGRLQDQPFFHNAENGDKVLIFQKAEKAILYRPSTDKIIEVGPITIQLPTESASVSGEIIRPLTVVLYNGSSTVGITQDIEDLLTQAHENVSVLERENAKSDYTQSLVIDLTGQRESDARILADLLKGKIAKLPDEEASPEADMLIIVGSDYKKAGE